MVTFSPPTQQTGVRFPAVAGRPVTRLYLVQLRLEMHTPWFVGLTPLQLVQYLGTEWLRVTEKEMSTSGNPRKWERPGLVSCCMRIKLRQHYCTRRHKQKVGILYRKQEFQNESKAVFL